MDRDGSRTDERKLLDRASLAEACARASGSAAHHLGCAVFDDLLATELATPRLSSFLLGVFALVALLLAAIGLYGVMAFTVREETREIGLRMALGAGPEQVRRDVLRRALSVIAIGGAAGLLGALVSSRFLAGLLFQVQPADPVALGAACLLLGLVALAAAYVPARRATHVDPAIALRSE